MALDTDLTGGHSISDDVLDKIEASFGRQFNESDPSDVVAALRALDKELNLAQADDRIVIHPSMGVFLLYVTRISAPASAAAHFTKWHESTYEGEGEYELDPDMLTTWLEYTFDATNPETGEKFPYHPELVDQTIKIRFMTDDEVAANPDFFCATVRADGTLISTSKTSRKYT